MALTDLNAMDMLVAATYDVIVCGAKEAGLGAAIGAARRGMRVLLVSENDRIGGMLGGGINQSDVNSSASPGLCMGFAREFYTGIANAETNPFTLREWWRAEGPLRPSWVRRRIGELVAAEKNIAVLYNATLVGAVPDNAGLRCTLTFEEVSGARKTFTTRVAIDGSYAGDLQQRAGLSVSVGREATALYGESYAGTRAPGAWNVAGVDPYVVPGDAASGILYPLRTNPATVVGSGDGLVMEFGYRLFFTSVATDKMPIPDPAPGTYDAQRYELLGRAMAADPTYWSHATNALTRLLQFYDLFRIGGTAMGPTFMRYVDINSSGPISTNFPDADLCREYVTATPARRRQIEALAWQWTIGLLYFVKTDARVPAILRDTLFNNYGFSTKEWKLYGGRPPEFYVREGARVIGDFVMTQQHAVTFANGLTNPIARLYYDLDSHNVQRYVVAGQPRVEGAQLNPLGAEVGAAIPWTTLLPKATESKVTLHPGMPSWSNVVHRSGRMGPIQLQMGYAAGVAASLAVEDGVAVQAIDVARLMRIIDIDETTRGLTASPDAGTFVQAVRSEIAGTGAWAQAGNRFGFLGNYARQIAAGSTTKVRYQPRIYDSGMYQVRLLYPARPTTRASNVTIRIVDGNGTTSARTINQLFPGGGGGFWEDLGTFYFRGGPSTADPTSPDYIEIDPTGANDVVVEGGVQFIPIRR